MPMAPTLRSARRINVAAVTVALLAGALHARVNWVAGDAEDASVLTRSGTLDYDGDGDIDGWDLLVQLDGEFQPG